MSQRSLCCDDVALLAVPDIERRLLDRAGK
jgi:hypothetical protein